MKYTLEEIKHAVRVIKETCVEHYSDCCGCPLDQVGGWGEHTCIMNLEWPPVSWDVDEIGEGFSDTEGGDGW